MSVKKTNKTSNEMASEPYKVWREKPPGPEQKELDRMFQCNEIDASSTPDSVRKSNELFRQYPSRIFAPHFRKTKAKHGLCATVFDQPGGSSSQIAELGTNSSLTFLEPSIEENQTIVFQNAPFCTWTYTDHKKRRDFVCLAVPIFSGSRNVHFTLSEDGLKVTVHYIWATAIYTASQLFEIRNDDDIAMNHPRVQSFMSHMLNQGFTDKSSPKGSTTITLPMRVQRETDGWTKKAVHATNTRIMLVEMMAYQKSKFIDEEDTSINFD